MEKHSTIIVAVPPEHESDATRPGCAAAHMAYKIGRGFRLYRSLRSSYARGGFMVLDTGEFLGGGPLSSLVSDTMDECAQKGFTGIALDAGAHPASPAQIALSTALAKASARQGLEFFVPEALSGSGENAIVRVSTALSGGTLGRHIADASARYGQGRIALELERVRMDFTLPALRGTGTALSNEEVRELMSRYNARPFFSPELMVNYFTYHKKGPHIVLYDDAKSLRRKLFAGARAGVKYAFLFYPHIADIYDEILGNSGGV